MMAHMMAHQESKSVRLPYQLLNARGGIYFSSIVLSMWDNIHGPTVLMTWKGKENEVSVEENEDDGFIVMSQATTGKSTKAVADDILLTIANFTLNDEAGRVEKLDGIETKFYCLKKYDVIASVSVFSIEISRGKPEVFSFILILPLSEMSEFLPRHPVCESKVQRLLKDHLIVPLKEKVSDRAPIHTKMEQVLIDFHHKLFPFTQVMLSIRTCGLPEKIEVSDTYFGVEASKVVDMKPFLSMVISAHLQSSGYTVVLGSDKTAVDKMILTLGMLLSSKERKMSRFVWQSDEGALYEPDLFLQGLILSSDTNVLPFTKGDLYLNKLPPTMVHMDTKEDRNNNSAAGMIEKSFLLELFSCSKVLVLEPKITKFIRKQEEQADDRRLQQRREKLYVKDLSQFNRELVSKMVQDFLEHIALLPVTHGVRETYITQFHKQLRMKALTLTKYVDADPKPSIQEFAAEVLALGRGANLAERPRINQASLQQDLSIDTAADLLVILAFAEKIRPKTYLDVLGDPQYPDLAMLHEFQNF